VADDTNGLSTEGVDTVVRDRFTAATAEVPLIAPPLSSAGIVLITSLMAALVLRLRGYS